MKNNSRNQRSRIHKSWLRAFRDGIFFRNPVLTTGAGLYFVLTGSQSMGRATALSLLTVCLMLPACAVGNLLGRRIAYWLRLPLALLVSALAAVPAQMLVQLAFPQTTVEWGFLGLLSISNAVVLVRASRYAPEKSFGAAIADALGCAAGFSLLLFLLAAVWSALYGMELSGQASFSRAPVMVGLLVLACLAAAVQYIQNRREKRERGKTL